MGGIFISYRREDSHHAAGRLYDSLQGRFSSAQIFLDIDNMEPGLNFLAVLRQRVAESEAMLVVIGPHWLDAKDSLGRRRLDNPEDYVRVEIEGGLERGMRVIPVLLDGTEMPRGADLPSSLKSLALLHAVTIGHATFQRDAEYLNDALSQLVRPAKGGKESRKWKAGFARRSWTSFVIHFGLDSEHVLEASVTSRWFDKVLLDGREIYKFAMNGRHTVDFQIPGQPNHFRLLFTLTVLMRLHTIELWRDSERILEAA